MVCSQPHCIAIATVGGLCAPHAAGYRKHDGSKDLHCARCHHEIENHAWYQLKDGAHYHVKACKPPKPPAGGTAHAHR